MGDHVEYPWKAEYAKSSRAGCKTCKGNIMKESLRIAKMVQVKWQAVSWKLSSKYNDLTNTKLASMARLLNLTIAFHDFVNTGNIAKFHSVTTPYVAKSSIYVVCTPSKIMLNWIKTQEYETHYIYMIQNDFWAFTMTFNLFGSDWVTWKVSDTEFCSHELAKISSLFSAFRKCFKLQNWYQNVLCCL